MRTIDRLRRAPEEIVADIIEELGVGPAIKGNVDSLAGWMLRIRDAGTFEGNRKTNTEFARRMIKWIDAGRNIKFPKDGVLLEILFGPRGRIDTVERIEATVRQAEANYKDLTDRMEVLRQRCHFIVQAGVGSHGHAVPLQRSAVIAAKGLCETAGVPLVWTDPDTTCRRVASYFYELATGERDHELERARKWIAKQTCGGQCRSRPFTKASAATKSGSVIRSSK
jgi:hypothetical protein